VLIYCVQDFYPTTALVLWLSIKERFAQKTRRIPGILVPICFVDKICFGKDFVSRSQVEVPFQESPADAEILKDTSNYRVF
jgi:hypothetical protein